MTDILVTSPYRPFTLPNQFKAVFNGFIYCGTVDAVDPSNSQTQVYKVNEDGSRTPASQPLRSNAGGFLVYNGQPAKFVTDSNHSILVRDSLGNDIWYEPDVSAVDPESFARVLGSESGAALVGTMGGMNLSDYLLKGSGINPDMFPAPLSDAGRVQSAIDLWATDKTRTISLPRAYDVTGATLRVSNIETESPERSLVFIGGELIKLDAGYLFDKPATGQTLATGEVRFIGTKFRGPNVAGTYIINGHNDLGGTYDSAHMIRVSFVGCFGTGIQVAYAKPTGYLQSITMDANCVWRKWAGYLFDCGWMYDVQCFNPRMEAGDAVWVTREVNADPACSGCHFSGGNVEGLGGASGPAFDVGVCIGTTISPAYMEANAGGDINCSKGVGFHKGLTIMGVKMEPTPAQAADPNYYSVRLGKGAEGAFNLGGNFSTSNMYDCAAGNQAVVIDHSSFVAAGKKLFGPNVLRRFEPTVVGFHGQVADGFGVGALYEFRLFYVDGVGDDQRRYTGFGDAAPTAASHPGIAFGRGSMIYNRSAGLQDRQYGEGVVRSALIQGWQCIESGEPGVWREVAVMLPY